jgi:hypothetical protein
LYFQVKAGDEVIISLIGMKRPFTDLKALDIEELCTKITAE